MDELPVDFGGDAMKLLQTLEITAVGRCAAMDWGYAVVDDALFETGGR